MKPLWSQLRDALARHGRAALVTVAATKGSAPREAGARLIVLPDGTFSGTIGGGTLEWRAIALAQSMLTKPRAERVEMRKFALGPELGQCCGGQVELILELIGEQESAMVGRLAEREELGSFTTRARISATEGIRREIVGGVTVAAESAALDDDLLVESFGERARPLLLFGAGHVGRALVLSMAPLSFAVTWIDPRPGAFPAYLPGNVTAVQAGDPVDVLKEAAAGSFVLVMTHSHQLDLAIVAAALADMRFPYVGLIGSASKRARFEKRLADGGIARKRIAELVCPIGIDGIESKAPASIAAATAAQLLIRDEALRSARHAPTADQRRAG
jgi:xanthine dehydrogenase accessory factor